MNMNYVSDVTRGGSNGFWLVLSPGCRASGKLECKYCKEAVTHCCAPLIDPLRCAVRVA